MLSAVILSYIATVMLLAEQLVHQRYVHPGPLVLGTNPVKFPTRIADRDRTVSRRSEPSSRTTLIGERQTLDFPAPGCDEPTSRCQTPPSIWTLGGYQLLSPACTLSVERWPFHSEPPDHYDRLSTLLDMYVSQSAGFCHCTLKLISDQPEPTIARLRYHTGGDRPSQTTHHTGSTSR